MAFSPESLSLLVQPIGDVGLRIYSYRTDDTEATVTGAAYATNAAYYGLRAADLIVVTPVTLPGADPYIMSVDTIDADGHATLASPGPIGDMLKSVYDPTAVGGDAFDSNNHAFLQAGIGAVERTSQDKMRDTASVKDFGAVGDGVTPDRAAVQAAWDAGAAAKRPVHMTGDFAIEGDLVLEDDLEVHWVNGAVTKQTDFSVIGAFIHNLEPNSSSADTIVSNVLLKNPQIDGSEYPEPTYLEIGTGSTDTAIVLTAAASSVTGFYNGLAVAVCTGAGAGHGLRFVSSYDGPTRTLTLTGPALAAPSAGDIIAIGYNDNAIGFSAGASDVRIEGGVIENWPATLHVPFAAGAKGVNFEQGVTNGSVWGTTFRNCGTAVFVQGLDGSFVNTAKKRAVGVRVGGYHAETCGSVLTIAGVNANQLPDGDSDDSLITASLITYENAGHSPYRIVGSDPQKSGIINLLEAQNFYIENVEGRNDSTYPGTSPGYPTDYDKRVGYGLTGPVGAMIWGHGRNGSIKGFRHHGDVDNLVRIQRGRALGDDGTRSDGPTSGTVGNCYNLRFLDLQHYGTAMHVVSIDPNLGLRVPADQLTGEISATVDTLSVGICDPNMSAFEGLIVDVTERGTGKRVIGTPKQIIAAGNTFASFDDMHTDLRTNLVLVLADDEAVQINPPRRTGFMLVTIDNSAATGFAGLIHYCTIGAAQCVALAAGANIAVGTTALTTGTGDGVDTDLNIAAVIAATDGIYIKNRSGASRGWRVSFL